MKTIRTRLVRRRHDLLREFFACAVVIAAHQIRPTPAQWRGKDARRSLAFRSGLILGSIRGKHGFF